MKTIRCSKCHQKIFRYQKIGKGRILRCYKPRIVEDYSIREGNLIICQCGQLIGVDKGAYIKMKQSAFISSGTISNT